ncbi:amino acid adenylation domain-containing protein [Paenibacillus oenotherae]|uniref:Amino acid adenylation domain-containing protein n=1 Tax=Paenibacillus oenotherae TaxID=1435645 RepID=A0ABS7D302_9BACL|nr:amino acid adenylation domain-containing protein [Paenibacillus oenotherae]MBW7473811.1 amino acid adenylation domain-containing protein [Paenibacillus oenotherae]
MIIQNPMLHAAFLNKETAPEQLELYLKRLLAEQSFKQYELELGEAASRMMNELAGRWQLTLDSLVLGIWGVLLSRYTDEYELALNFAVMKDGLPSLFSIETVLDEQAGFGEWVRGLQQATVEAAGGSAVSPGNEVAKADFHVYAAAAGEQCVVTFIYNEAVYDRQLAVQAAQHFQCIVQAVAGNPDIALKDIDILTNEERDLLLTAFGGAAFSFSRDKSIHHSFEDQAAAKPDGIALIYEDERFTYREVNENANRLAHWIIGQGVGKEQLVAILMNRGPRMAESILAVWKAGAAYIPLDPAYPLERIKGILSDSGCCLVLTDTEAAPPLLQQEVSCPAAYLDSLQSELERCPADNPNVHVDIHQLAYVIYTSGSTGKPKGAMVEHLGMMNHLYAKTNDLQITGDSIVVQNASHCFDISVWQYFVALVAGGTTLIYPNDLAADPDSLIDCVIADEATILEVVPSYLSVMLEFLESDFREFPQLKALVVTGETLKGNVVKRWLELYPAIPMVNAYGPTEASDDITHHIMNEVPELDTIPVGKPVHNFQIYIVDKGMRLCPMGVKGEICVSGIGVGRGYLNDKVRTEAVFMSDPFTDEAGRRLYKTGDLGRWLPGGIIEFFGRKDHQVKIRGFRIELGEIENKLVNHPDVNEAVVVDLEDEIGTKYLCAYLVGRSGMDTAAVKTYISQLLPYYMVPSYLIQLDQMPVTPNGKVDRKALPRPNAMALV